MKETKQQHKKKKIGGRKKEAEGRIRGKSSNSPNRIRIRMGAAANDAA